MTSPVRTEQYITAMQKLFNANATAEDIYRSYYFPAMNAAYQDGKAGEPGYPMTPEAEITAFEDAQGYPACDWSKRFIAVFVRSLNAAYTQGREKARRSFQQ